MNKFQISETVNISSSLQNISNTQENPSNFSNSNIGLISSKMANQKYPQETSLSTRGNVKSYCRIRPNRTIYSNADKFTIENNNKTLEVDFTSEQDRNNPSKQFKYKYNFTEIFSTSVKNEEIYEKVCKQSIKELFSMHKNALIFVYGITNSGKTYTVIGNMDTKGILQHSLKYLFDEFSKLKENNNCWKLTCTYIEIYNEEVFDLLSKEKKKLRVVGGGNKFYAQGCIIKNIESKDDFTEALTIGENNRTKAETNVNPYSSRSHSIFRVELSYNDKDGFCLIEPVSLCIVDLAGAERVSKSGVIGTNLKEAGNINSSLLVLKKCFEAMEVNSRTNLVEKKVIVPVRESKLTLLFKEYFAAHQNISVICTINPDRNEMMDIRSVLNFGAKAMKVKPVKSWIPTYNYNSKEINSNKTGNRGNSPFVSDNNKKKYRLLTEKKYLDKKYNYSNNNININNNHYLQNSSSKENISKVKEDSYSNNSYDYYSSKKKDMTTSAERIQNLKIISHKNHENIKSPSYVLNLHNENRINKNTPNKKNKLLFEERMKCYNNPFNFVASKENNLFVKNSPSKEKLKLEQELKERREKEIKDKISKNKEDIKNLMADMFNKKIYYKNLEQNIDIYERQCKNIDLDEVQALLNIDNNNNSINFYSLENPFAKNYQENNFASLSKTHTINLAYLKAIKEQILKNENNINISYKPSKKNQNLEIISNYNMGYVPDKSNNNEFDIFRGNRELIDELQLKLNNSEHDQAKIMEFLDKSFEQYNASQFKAYFGIGNSLVKKLSEEKKEKEKENKNDAKNDIEMAEKIDKAENDENINFNVNDIVIDFLSNEYNFKGKGKNSQNINNKEKKEKEKERKDLDVKKYKENKNEESNEEEENKKKRNKTKEKKSKKEKKPKKKRKNKKKYESDSEDEKEKESEKEKEKESDKESDEEEVEENKPEIESKKAKEKEIDEEKDNSKEDDSESEKEQEKEKEKKSRKRRKNVSKNKKRVKKSKSKSKNKIKVSNDDESNEEEKENKDKDEENNSSDEEKEKKVVSKKRKKKKNKKKKIESDVESDEDISEENENIKPGRKRKKGTKKNKK